jgi:hypothetical protein
MAGTATRLWASRSPGIGYFVARRHVALFLPGFGVLGQIVGRLGEKLIGQGDALVIDHPHP